MVRKALDTLLSRGVWTEPGPSRPNQLRREDVDIERRRREASRDREQTSSTSRRQAARRMTVTEAPGTERRRLQALLSSRSGLRQVLMAREVLGPPLALREQDATWRRW